MVLGTECGNSSVVETSNQISRVYGIHSLCTLYRMNLQAHHLRRLPLLCNILHPLVFYSLAIHRPSARSTGLRAAISMEKWFIGCPRMLTYDYR